MRTLLVAASAGVGGLMGGVVGAVIGAGLSSFLFKFIKDMACKISDY